MPLFTNAPTQEELASKLMDCARRLRQAQDRETALAIGRQIVLLVGHIYRMFGVYLLWPPEPELPPVELAEGGDTLRPLYVVPHEEPKLGS